MENIGLLLKQVLYKCTVYLPIFQISKADHKNSPYCGERWQKAWRSRAHRKRPAMTNSFRSMCWGSTPYCTHVNNNQLWVFWAVHFVGSAMRTTVNNYVRFPHNITQQMFHQYLSDLRRPAVGLWPIWTFISKFICGELYRILLSWILKIHVKAIVALWVVEDNRHT